MAQTPGVNTPYCDIYDQDGREILPNGLDRRVIGYFTSWRTGKNGQPSYLANDIPWDKVSHINYAFAHIDDNWKVSVNENVAGNAATDMTWPGVAGAEMDPTLPYDGYFNLLNKFKKDNPGVKVIPAVGGWAETGGYFDGEGNRVANGGFYTLTESQARIDTFADSVVDFIRTYDFDGIDIDYEYPTSNNQAGNPDDFAFSDARRGQLFSGYVDLMKTLREKLDAAGAEDGEYYMLTAAVPSSGWLLRGMEVNQVTEYLDFVNMMTYDLHGAWNEYVGGNGALYDDGKDPELAAAGVYGAYKGIGYLNADWSSHYWRGAMQGGRINLGVPFYTRGFQGVTGGENGMGGRAPAPAGFNCPAGTNNKCGYGAEGIDNLWYDSDPQGNAIPAGVNPIWHALNLENGITGDYVADYGVTDTLEGDYVRYFDSVTKNEWWWNEQTKTFLSGDSAEAISAKADYVANEGLGGLMIWEFAGDYEYNSTKGQYEMGSTLVDLMHSKLSATTPYGATKANADRVMPTEALDISIAYTEFALGDNNYPIAPKVVFTNNGSTDIPAGATVSFQYATTDTGEMSDWSGFGTTTTVKGHTGDNIGGLDGDFHTATFTVPAGGIPAGGEIVNNVKWTLPVAQFSNVIVTIDGVDYSTTYDHLRGATVVEAGSGTGGGDGGTGGGDNGGGTGTCSAAAWDSVTAYSGGARVSYNGHEWTARHWTQGDTPSSTNTWGPWADAGAC
ncbi:glycosyl hydrolase family 18 protein [Demequina sp. B12]|uniref:glycosyl hydrolase family 18 protein n=1 Tax=Demequina sp. B12 TaxID=2992757 RepID=UPI00237AE96E|nr:glycosyl hydrolase family 18 protein [Demequina sp. B12]MDE0572622.1 glycosyl hydrolase family 18 protein [Demequina sp. B12]